VTDSQTDGQTESIMANTALCIAIAMLTRCKNRAVTGEYCYRGDDRLFLSNSWGSCYSVDDNIAFFFSSSWSM